MEEVLCWCCEYYTAFAEDIDGICGLNSLFVSFEGDACENFLLKSGLHTNRTIPKYCNNYKNGEPVTDSPKYNSKKIDK